MIGAIAGDIIGSVYEFQQEKPAYNFKPLFHIKSRFTDDTLHTIALMDSILHDIPYERLLKKYFHQYPNRGHGKMFYKWAYSNSFEPYNSFGNGSAMRTSPVGWIGDKPSEVMLYATKYASVTHNHTDGIRGAIVTSLVILMARTGIPQNNIHQVIKEKFYPSIDKYDYDWLVKNYTFDVTCRGTVPVAVSIFTISNSYEDCIRRCVAVGGDTDTLCAIAGGMAEAKWGVSDDIKQQALKYLTPSLRDTVNEFYDYYKIK